LNGADPKEAALQIQELQDHVTALRTQLAEQRELLASRWQSLSEQQRADFVDVLKELEIPERSTSPSLMLNPDFTHQDSVELAHTLSHLCAQARWGAPVYGDNLVMQQRGRPSGITVCANQERPDVKVFLRALRKVGLPYQSEREAINESIVVKIGRRIGDS
jgi:hypothetical protein